MTALTDILQSVTAAPVVYAAAAAATGAAALVSTRKVDAGGAARVEMTVKAALLAPVMAAVGAPFLRPLLDGFRSIGAYGAAPFVGHAAFEGQAPTMVAPAGPTILAPVPSINADPLRLAGPVEADLWTRAADWVAAHGWALATVGLGLWASMAVVGLLRAARRRRRFIASLRREPVDEATFLHRAARDVAERSGLKSAPRLTTSPFAPTPMVVGRREICLPEDAADWPADRLEAVLAHECAHIARGDLLWRRLADFAARVMPVPFLGRVLARRLEQASEFAADARARRILGDGAPLAQCLVDVASRRTFGDERGLVCALSHQSSPITARVEALLRPPERLRAAWPAVLTVCVSGALAACAGAVAVPEDESRKAEAPDAPRALSPVGPVMIAAMGDAFRAELGDPLMSVEDGELVISDVWPKGKNVSFTSDEDGVMRKLRIEPDGQGGPEIIYTEDGEKKRFDKDARRWAANAYLEHDAHVLRAVEADVMRARLEHDRDRIEDARRAAEAHAALVRLEGRETREEMREKLRHALEEARQFDEETRELSREIKHLTRELARRQRELWSGAEGDRRDDLEDELDDLQDRLEERAERLAEIYDERFENMKFDFNMDFDLEFGEGEPRGFAFGLESSSGNSAPFKFDFAPEGGIALSGPDGEERTFESLIFAPGKREFIVRRPLYPVVKDPHGLVPDLIAESLRARAEAMREEAERLAKRAEEIEARAAEKEREAEDARKEADKKDKTEKPIPLPRFLQTPRL